MPRKVLWKNFLLPTPAKQTQSNPICPHTPKPPEFAQKQRFTPENRILHPPPHPQIPEICAKITRRAGSKAYQRPSRAYQQQIAARPVTCPAGHPESGIHGEPFARVQAYHKFHSGRLCSWNFPDQLCCPNRKAPRPDRIGTRSHLNSLLFV